MKPPVSIVAGVAAACIMLCGSIVQAQSVIGSVYPNGAYQFQSSSALSFTASSLAGITNISVTLTATTLQGQQGFPETLTLGNGLIVTGPSAGETVSAALASNMLYLADIQVTDANGNSASTNLSFDTINPAYTFEARDWDYTSNGTSGLFIDNPQTNAYAGLASAARSDFYIDNSGGSASYRPQGLETETAGDVPRLAYIGTTNVDFDVGYNNGGNWGNYTRHYPAGTYNLYLRGSDGNSSQSDAASLTVVSGTAALSGTGPYQFSVTAKGWQTYGWCPLIDGSSGNPAQITFDGSASTLRVNIDNGNCNENFYMLVPVDTNAPVVGTGVVTGAFPNGAYQFQQTNTFSFTAASAIGINNIAVEVADTNLLGQGSVTRLTSGSGLTITGPATSESVSFGLTTDTLYSVTIQLTDASDNSSATNITFDTVNPDYYTFEAEDFDYNGGDYFDNPQTNAYVDLNGESGIDYNCPSPPQNNPYQYGRLGLATETTSDTPRSPYLSGVTDPTTGGLYKDYDVDSVNGGDWGNYTRNYPAGVYNIYMRAANGNNAVSDSSSISLVTGGETTSSQTLSQLGTFSVPGTGGWGTFTWVPLLNSGGGLVRFTGGSLATLRETTVNGSYNANYYMLVPANNTVKTLPFVDNFEPDGTALFQFTNLLSFTANSEPGFTTTNDVVLNLNGANVSGLIFNGSSTAWNVTYPVQPNTYYTAIVTLTDANGTTITTNSFGTFNATNYQWEAEDYDYTSSGVSGQFFDNPQVDSYAGLPGLTNVDLLESDLGAFSRGYNYRPAGYGGFPDTAANDLPRTQFTSVGATDWSIGSFGGGSWANYTRHYPAGTYNVVGRFAEGAGTSKAGLSLLTGGYGTSIQTSNLLGTFSIPVGGWSTWEWATLVNGSGSPVNVTLDGSQTTLQLEGQSGNEANVNFLMLVPANTTLPVISSLYPNGSSLFQYTNTLNFDVSSSAGIATNSITVTLNGVAVTNLVFSGTATSWNVSYPDLPENAAYTSVITVTSLNEETVSTTNSFDTFNAANYQWEAADYDYTTNGVGGLFFDNPQVDSYAGLPGLTNVDLLESDVNAPGRGNSYRPAGYGDFPDTAANDLPRIQFTSVGATDWSVGSFGGGSWANYTRHYPFGTYNVIGRFAEGAGAAEANLSQVTRGYATTNQTTSLIGTFLIPEAGWSSWESVELTDAHGNPASVTLDGSQATLQLEGVGNNEANINFFMLVPTTPAPKLVAVVGGGIITISVPAQSGYSYQLQYKNNLTDVNWTSLGSPFAGNDSVYPFTDTIVNGAGNRFYRVQIVPNP